jgi:transposase
MLVELGLVEQRLKAVHEVLDGATVIDVAARLGVTRQTVHVWLNDSPWVPRSLLTFE